MTCLPHPGISMPGFPDRPDTSTPHARPPGVHGELGSRLAVARGPKKVFEKLVLYARSVGSLEARQVCRDTVKDCPRISLSDPILREYESTTKWLNISHRVVTDQNPVGQSVFIRGTETSGMGITISGCQEVNRMWGIVPASHSQKRSLGQTSRRSTHIAGFSRIPHVDTTDNPSLLEAFHDSPRVLLPRGRQVGNRGQLPNRHLHIGISTGARSRPSLR